MASQPDHMANLALINRNYRDDTIYDVQPEKWNKYVHTGRGKPSGIIIRANVGGEYKETDINWIDGQGLGNVPCFVCPYPGCNKHLSRRHTGVQRHFENCHEKKGDPAGAIAQGMKWWSHATVATYTTWGKNGRGLSFKQKRERMREIVAGQQCENCVQVQNQMNMIATAATGPATHLHQDLQNQQYGVQNPGYAGLPGQQMLPPPIPNTNRCNTGAGPNGEVQSQGQTHGDSTQAQNAFPAPLPTYDFYDGAQWQLNFPCHPMLLDPDSFPNPSAIREIQRTQHFRVNHPCSAEFGWETDLHLNPLAQVPPGYYRRDDEVHAESQMNLAPQQDSLGQQALNQREMTPAEAALASLSAIPQQQAEALTQAEENWWATEPQHAEPQFGLQMTTQDKFFLEQLDKEFEETNMEWDWQ